MSEKPKFILFDLGNVIVHIHPEAFLQTLEIDTPENRLSYQPPIAEIVNRYERGDDTTEQFLNRLDTLLNGGSRKAPLRVKEKFTADELTQAMLAVIGRPVDGMHDLVRRVAGSVKVGLLSNTNPLHYELCQRDLPVLGMIPYHFLSFQLQSLKPEPLIFEKVLQRIALDPEEIIFIDDQPENVRAALGLNIPSFRFSTAGELEARFKEVSLID